VWLLLVENMRTKKASSFCGLWKKHFKEEAEIPAKSGSPSGCNIN
jgi:hypothetical protein